MANPTAVITQQPLRALSVANQRRTATALLKTRLRRGELTLAGVLEHPPADAGQALTFDVLLWAPQFGRRRLPCGPRPLPRGDVHDWIELRDPPHHAPARGNRQPTAAAHPPDLPAHRSHRTLLASDSDGEQHPRSQVLVDQTWRGRRWVVESDVANCFEAIPHSGLMSAIEERISDRHLLKLLRAMLRSGVMQDEAVMHSDTGTPQGGVVSPTLCNVYLHRLDRCCAERGAGMLVRFADDRVPRTLKEVSV